jgi:uncharacterized protein YjbJ (UPF0337 family)
MDENRIAGAVRRAKGVVKEKVGEIVGDAKLKNDGKVDQVAGKLQNAIGGLKDTAREAQDKR